MLMYALNTSPKLSPHKQKNRTGIRCGSSYTRRKDNEIETRDRDRSRSHDIPVRPMRPPVPLALFLSRVALRATKRTRGRREDPSPRRATPQAGTGANTDRRQPRPAPTGRTVVNATVNGVTNRAYSSPFVCAASPGVNPSVSLRTGTSRSWGGGAAGPRQRAAPCWYVRCGCRRSGCRRRNRPALPSASSSVARSAREVP